MGRVGRLSTGADSGEGGADTGCCCDFLHGALGCQFAVSLQTDRDMSLKESFEFLVLKHDYNYRKQWARSSFPRISVSA